MTFYLLLSIQLIYSSRQLTVNRLANDVKKHKTKEDPEDDEFDPSACEGDALNDSATAVPEKG